MIHLPFLVFESDVQSAVEYVVEDLGKAARGCLIVNQCECRDVSDLTDDDLLDIYARRYTTADRVFLEETIKKLVVMYRRMWPYHGEKS